MAHPPLPEMDLPLLGKLKLSIQPSTSLLVCKRACCLRWLESPVCHIHDVFPETRNILRRGTIYTVAGITSFPCPLPFPSPLPSLPSCVCMYVALPLSLSLSCLCFTRTLLSLGRVLAKRRAAVRLHCVERYVNMSTQLGYLPFLRRQFQVNSPNWLLSMLSVYVYASLYVCLYRGRVLHTLPRTTCARVRVFLESRITLAAARYTRANGKRGPLFAKNNE